MISIKNKTNTILSLLFAGAALIFVTSCAKTDDAPAGNAAVQPATQMTPVTDKATKKELERMSKEMPTIAWYNKAMDKIVSFNPQSQSKSFSFADPNPGWNFSDASQTAWYPAENGGGILFIGYGSFGSNTGSGTVIAGGTALDINYTFCFAASDDALGLDLVDLGESPSFDGISGVIGIDGDFDALQNEEIDEESSIFDYFHGLAYYVVYDNEAQGNYSILNWFEDLTVDPDDLSGEGFTWVYGFSPTEWSLYFSKNGTLNVSGGSMNFNGNYLGLIVNFNELMNNEDGDLESIFNFVEAPGYGEMGCS